MCVTKCRLHATTWPAVSNSVQLLHLVVREDNSQLGVVKEDGSPVHWRSQPAPHVLFMLGFGTLFLVNPQTDTKPHSPPGGN